MPTSKRVEIQVTATIIRRNVLCLFSTDFSRNMTRARFWWQDQLQDGFCWMIMAHGIYFSSDLVKLFVQVGITVWEGNVLWIRPSPNLFFFPLKIYLCTDSYNRNHSHFLKTPARVYKYQFNIFSPFVYLLWNCCILTANGNVLDGIKRALMSQVSLCFI